MSVLYTKPKKIEPWIFSFLNPLTLSVWMSIIAAYFVVSATLFLLSRISSGDKLFNVKKINRLQPQNSNLIKVEPWNPPERNVEEAFHEKSFDLKTSFWFVLASLLQQGIDTLPK